MITDQKDLEQQIMNAQARRMLDNAHLANIPAIMPGKVWQTEGAAMGAIGSYNPTPHRRTTIYIDEADNGKVIMIGDAVCRLVPEGANLADEIIIALTQARML